MAKFLSCCARAACSAPGSAVTTVRPRNLKLIAQKGVRLCLMCVQLREEISDEEEYLTIIESPPRKVVAVTDAGTYQIDFDGTKQTVKLHGLYIKPSRSIQIAKEFQKN